MALKETLRQKIEEFRPRTTRLVKEFGKVVIDQVTIDQAIGGARDIRSRSYQRENAQKGKQAKESKFHG